MSYYFIFSLPSHVNVTLSFPKTRPNIFIPIPASAGFLTGDVITVPLGSRTWNNFNDYHLLLLTCSRILEYFDTSSPSSLKNRIRNDVVFGYFSQIFGSGGSGVRSDTE